jgi:hypothetical protein
MDQNLDPLGSGIIAQDAHDILGSVGGGKDPPPPFFHNRNAAGLEKGDQVLVEKPGERIIKKFAVVMEIFDEGRQVPGVGQVAPALAGEGQLNPHPPHFLQQEDSASPFGGPSGSHQAGGPAADDNHIPVHDLLTTEGTENAAGFNFQKPLPKVGFYLLGSLFFSFLFFKSYPFL